MESFVVHIVDAVVNRIVDVVGDGTSTYVAEILDVVVPQEYVFKMGNTK